MHKKSAFTLIELLVVIAIIAMLMAIIVPVSIKGIEMARRSSKFQYVNKQLRLRQPNRTRSAG